MDENGKSAVLDMQGKAGTQQTAPASAPGPAWARWRAPLGYPTAALCLWFAHPTFRSIVAGSVIASAGLVIRAMAAGHLRKREALAQSGPYAYTRNPLYLGSAFIAAGFALAALSWIAAGLLALYFVVFYEQVMRREESELREQYGKTFDEYARSVPRFLPKLRVKIASDGGRFSFAQYVRNREYSAAIGAALTIAVLAILALWRK